jgi:phosphoribosyl-ATP pyrophosphohydrolase
VAKLLADGPALAARKVGEEAVELVVEALAGSDERFVSEAADLLFHFTVLLESRNITLKTVIDELECRA